MHLEGTDWGADRENSRRFGQGQGHRWEENLERGRQKADRETDVLRCLLPLPAPDSSTLQTSLHAPPLPPFLACFFLECSSPSSSHGWFLFSHSSYDSNVRGHLWAFSRIVPSESLPITSAHSVFFVAVPAAWNGDLIYFAVVGFYVPAQDRSIIQEGSFPVLFTECLARHRCSVNICGHWHTNRKDKERSRIYCKHLIRCLVPAAQWGCHVAICYC